jgi:hypothetical protein
LVFGLSIHVCCCEFAVRLIVLLISMIYMIGPLNDTKGNMGVGGTGFEAETRPGAIFLTWD